MGAVHVKGATVAGSRIERLHVGLDRLPDRTIDRATAIRWMKDGHSLLLPGGPALQLVEVGDGHVIRTDNAPVDEDRLPDLPPA